jgi:peptidoglycan/xylan/chitin deacetylase (PgdA/CDA1 family)
MSSLVSSAKGLFVGALGASLGNRLAVKTLTSFAKGYQILTYHRVLPQWDALAIAPVAATDFRKQMKLLKDCYHVVSLEQLLKDLDAGQLKPGTVCVTLDDGYRDNLDFALPILKAYGIPATIFLATDFIGGKGTLWYDKVMEAFRKTTRSDFTLAEAGITKHTLKGLTGRFHPAHLALEWLKNFSPSEREAKMKLVYAALDLKSEPSVNLMLDWDQVRSMRRENISFGAHTCSHPILSTISREANEFEITESKAVIERELREPVTLFAYPNGRKGDYGDDAKMALTKAGFACALTTNPGVNPAHQDRFEMCRSQPWEDSVNRFHGRMLLERMSA